METAPESASPQTTSAFWAHTDFKNMCQHLAVPGTAGWAFGQHLAGCGMPRVAWGRAQAGPRPWAARLAARPKPLTPDPEPRPHLVEGGHEVADDHVLLAQVELERVHALMRLHQIKMPALCSGLCLPLPLIVTIMFIPLLPHLASHTTPHGLQQPPVTTQACRHKCVTALRARARLEAMGGGMASKVGQQRYYVLHDLASTGSTAKWRPMMPLGIAAAVVLHAAPETPGTWIGSRGALRARAP